MAGAVKEFMGRVGYEDLAERLGIEGESEVFQEAMRMEYT